MNEIRHHLEVIKIVKAQKICRLESRRSDSPGELPNRINITDLLLQPRLLLDFLDQSRAKFLVAAVHGQVRFPVTKADNNVSGACLGFE